MLFPPTHPAPVHPEAEAEAPAASGEELRALWRFLAAYLRPHVALIAALLVIVLFESAFNAAFSVSLKYLIDGALLQRNGRVLVWTIAVLASAGLLVSLAGLLGDYLQATICANAVTGIRRALFAHLQNLPLAFFERSSSGAIMSRFSGDVLAIEQALASFAPSCLLPLAEAAFSTAILMWFNAGLAFTTLLIIPLTILGPKLFADRLLASAFQKRVLEAAMLSSTQENIQAQSLVKAYGLEPWSSAWFQKFNNRLRSTVRRFLSRSAFVERSAEISTLLLHVIILSIGAYLAFIGMMTIGTLVAFEAIFLSLCYAIGYVLEYLPVAAQAAGAAKHIAELYHQPVSIHDSPSAIDLPDVRSEIVFRDVSFSYAADRPALKDVSFCIAPGAFVAFVGDSGSGKTTILNLLLRFYDPDAGAVFLEGHDLRCLTLKSLRRRIGIVFQDSFLFNLSIRENILFGDLSATVEDIEKAARAAEIHDFIASLPQGYNSTVGERGVQLSGGQRQRLAIARAIVRDPRILLLDEATSALDASAEAAIQDTLMRLRQNRTIIAVTHRLHSVVNADTIYVLSSGRLTESGSHEQLLRRGSVYPKLWVHQRNSSILL